MEEVVRLKIEVSRLLELAAKSHGKGDNDHATELVQQAMRLSRQAAIQSDIAPLRPK
jgi:hypothetical protein